MYFHWSECEESTYGLNCTSQCQCSGEEVCDRVKGCVCNSGWEGTGCNIDIDECARKTYSCKSGEECRNTPGSYTCRCPDGYRSVNDTCQECPPFFFGEFCSQPCGCSQSNAISCNHSNGSCQCKRPWGGAECKTDVDECLDSSMFNCSADTECQNTYGSYECVCRHGYTKNQTSGLCEACTCNMTNTVTCDRGSGQCTCSSNWTGQTCNEDVDECLTSPCPANIKCVNTLGGFMCQCEGGMYQNSQGNCAALRSIPVKIKYDFDVSGMNLSNVSGPDFVRLKSLLELKLKEVFSKKIKGHLKIEILGLRAGSLDVEFVIIVASSNTVSDDVSLTLYQLATESYQLDGQNVTVLSVQVNTTQFSFNTTLCEKRLLIDPCPSTSQCFEENKSTRCISKSEAVVYGFDMKLSTDNLNQNLDLTDENSEQYISLRLNLTQQLTLRLNESLPGLTTSITKLRSGSIFVTILVLIPSGVDNPAGKLIKALKNLLGSNLTISDMPSTVLDFYVRAVAAQTSNLCDLYIQLVQTCSDGCIVQENTPVCSESTKSSRYPLIVGLAVGIPLFCLLLITVGVIVFVWVLSVKRRKGQLKVMKKEPDWYGAVLKSARQTYQNEAYVSEQATSSESSSSQEDTKGNGAYTNIDFSWENVYQKSESTQKDYEIPRPRVVS
ncbi:uncharacterized protein LOC131952397 [Physella acuta]|uniref:uncharacterized protein LOC131952397 n=1 Tax=Physella acuta TaxID=109671 RepID=UPI0027DD98D7|nr:uncharacterized protein LOC131952397 [Physella acuta]